MSTFPQTSGTKSRDAATAFGRVLSRLRNTSHVARRRLTALFIWSAIGFSSVYLWIFEPGKTGFFPTCPFRMLTGLNCPGCGSTRGLHRLVHGDLLGAFQFNALLVIVLPFMFYALARYTLAAATGRPYQRHYVKPRYLWMLIGLIMAFWIVRNTRFYPFPI